MSKDEILIRYSRYLKEVEKDIFILEENLNQLKKFFPLNDEKIQYLASKRDTLKILDQLAYRFLNMKASEVLEVLRISRITLKRLREKGLIKAIRKPNRAMQTALYFQRLENQWNI